MLAAEKGAVIGVGCGEDSEPSVSGEIDSGSIWPTVLEFGDEASPVGEELHENIMPGDG